VCFSSWVEVAQGVCVEGWRVEDVPFRKRCAK
jgi:hypothetical protein